MRASDPIPPPAERRGADGRAAAGEGPPSSSPPQISSFRFVAVAAAWMVALFGLLRLPLMQDHLLLPFAAVQQRLAAVLFGAPSGTVVLDASCSGAEVMALCLGLILAAPVTWRRRLDGAALGLLLIGGLNTLRIGHLSFAATDRARLDLLHVYLWPAVLTVAASAYALVWLWRATAPAAADAAEWMGRPGWRFLIAAPLLAAAYFAVAPGLFESGAFEGAAAWVTAAAAAAMGAFGVTVAVSGNVLRTAHGAFLVTQECIVTPLIAVYAAAVVAAPLGAARRGLALAVTPLLFLALGVARLLVLAVPAPLISSHTIAVHGFSQMLLGGVLAAAAGIAAAGPWSATVRRAVEALAAGLAAGIAAAALWRGALEVAVTAGQVALGHGGHALPDPQGALSMLPAYQIGLLVALWAASRREAGWRRLAAGVAALAVSQVALLAGLGELFHHIGLHLHASLIRAWAVVAPTAVALLLWRPFGGGRAAGLVATRSNGGAATSAWGRRDGTHETAGSP